MRANLANPPAPLPKVVAGKSGWVHEAPTRPNQAVLAAPAAEANFRVSEALLLDSNETKAPLCDVVGSVGSATATDDAPRRGPGDASEACAVSERLSDPGRWFQSISPAAPWAPQPAMEARPEQVRRRRVGGTLVTVSMALSLVILFAATIVRVRAAMGAEHARAMASAPAPAPVQPQLGGVHRGSADVPKGLLR